MKRRDFLLGGAAAGAVALSDAHAAPAPSRWEASYSGGPLDVEPLPPGQPGRDYQPVVVPNGEARPFKIVDGVKVFHLIAEEFEHEFLPGLKATVWGYNGRQSGTVIEAVEGERVRI